MALDPAACAVRHAGALAWDVTRPTETERVPLMAADDDEMMEPDEEIEVEAEELDGPDLDVAELDEDELEGELEEADDEFGVIDVAPLCGDETEVECRPDH